MSDLQKLAIDAGMNTSLWKMGSGSLVFTNGCKGVARDELERFAALVRAEALKDAGAPALLVAAKRALNVLRAQGESVQPTNVLGALDAAIRAAKS